VQDYLYSTGLLTRNIQLDGVLQDSI